MKGNWLKIFLRLALGLGFLSAVADRLGWWPKSWVPHPAWGNWENFLNYTAKINPWLPLGLIPTAGFVATVLEIILGIFLILGFKTQLSAKVSGWLLLLFALSMTFSTGIKSAFDASVFAASAGAFALGTMSNTKFLELDSLFPRKYKDKQ